VSNIYLALIESFNSDCIPLDALGIFLVVYQGQMMLVSVKWNAFRMHFVTVN